MKRLTDEQRAARFREYSGQPPMSAVGAWAFTLAFMVWHLGGVVCMFLGASLDVGWLGIVGVVWFALAMLVWMAALSQFENDRKAEHRVFWQQHEEKWGSR